MLPRHDDRTLSAYLLSIADTLHQQINRGLPEETAARLGECATIAARVAQQLDDNRQTTSWTFTDEAAALAREEPAFAAAEASRAQVRPAASSGARRIDPAALESYLQGHPDGGGATQVREAKLLAGGRCKLTALVSQTGAANLPEAFILRQDWQGGATTTTVAEEFGLLHRVVAGGLRAPRPLLLERSRSVVGDPFMLLERMPGRQHGSLFTPPRSSRLALQLAEQLGLLHALPLDGLAVDANDAASRVTELDALRRSHAEIGIASRVIDRALDWLAANLHQAGSALCLIHNDVGFHNALVDGEELTAILDWELAAPGHPAADLGYIRHFVEQMVEWQAFVQAYEAAGGWHVQEQELRFHTVWNAVRLYHLIMLARAALAAGRVNDVEIAFACADNLMLLLDSLARRLTESG